LLYNIINKFGVSLANLVQRWVKVGLYFQEETDHIVGDLFAGASHVFSLLD
jgi:hypothetical protein